MKTQQGVTLIEMLVAVTIGLLLMSGVLAIMSSTKKTAALQNELSRLQEDARFLMEDLSYNVRMAGYFGCSGIVRDTFNKTQAISVQNDIDVRDENNKTISKTTPASDILTVSHFGVHGRLRLNYPNAVEIENTTHSLDKLKCTDLTAPSPTSTPAEGIALEAWCQGTATDINLCQQVVSEKNYIKTQQCAGTGFLNSNTGFVLHPDSILPDEKSTVIVADCSGADFYTVASKPTGSPPVLTLTPVTTARCGNNLCQDYFWPVELFYVPEIDGKTKVEDRLQVTYEVKAIDKDGNGKASDDIDGFALFRNDELFIEGVQSLQIRYGVDTDSNGVIDRYIQATSTPIGQVIAVRLNILMRTANKRFDLTGATNREFELDPNLDTFNPSANNHIEHEEGYRHRLLTMTIRVRN